MLEIGDYNKYYAYSYNEGYQFAFFEGAVSIDREFFAGEQIYRERLSSDSEKKLSEKVLCRHIDFVSIMKAKGSKSEILVDFLEKYESLSDEKFTEKVFQESEYWPINLIF